MARATNRRTEADVRLQADLPASAPTLAAGELLSSEASTLKLRLLSGSKGLERLITAPRIQKPGLALAGYTEYIHPGRVQVLGVSEITFVNGLRAVQRRRAIGSLLKADMACIIITTGQKPPEDLLRGALDRGIPVFVTPLPSSQCIERVTAFLNRRLALTMSIHAVLMDIFGLGVLIIGESGIGKSECALELIIRGHRLVADDIVEIRRDPSGQLIGTSPDLIKHHMELRGIGLINIRDMYGISSISPSTTIDLVVSLERWNESEGYERLGLDDSTYEILDVGVPLVRMPVAAGRNLTILIEVAARNQLLKTQGYHPAKRFTRKLKRRLAKGER
ncbi:MAG: HPr(Ser) kinase/phosphatase [Acidobacteriota bacterium]